MNEINSGKRKMIVLGTGQAVCTRYYNTCFALTDGKDYFLVDGGGGGDILRCMARMEIPWDRLHHAFLSHEHTDHLLGMVWVVRYVAELIAWGRYKGNFNIYSNRVAGEKLRTVCSLLLKKTQRDMLGERILFHFVEDGRKEEILGDTFTFFDIHSGKAVQYGFRMEAKEGFSLVFLGDEPFSETCSKWMEPCDWLLSEAFCLYAERDIYNPYQYSHSTVREACECAERFHAKNLVLWHTEDETTYGFRKESYSKEAKGFFGGNVYVPDDFDIIDLC